MRAERWGVLVVGVVVVIVVIGAVVLLLLVRTRENIRVLYLSCFGRRQCVYCVV